MAAVKISTESEHGGTIQWWGNFLSFVSDKQLEESLYPHLTFSYININLSECGARVVFNNDNEYIEFETSEDATAFILRWS